MRYDVDAVVVGSGFGAAASACRLAEDKKSVLVLERGKTYAPMSFPRAPHDVGRNFWDPSEGLHGLFDLWSFKGLEAVVASGLGGGSLIYANVLIRKPPSWFVREDPRQPGYEYWPVCYEDLEPYYERAEEMLGATPYPFAQVPYDATPKTNAYRQAANDLNLEWHLPKLAVTFGADRDTPVPGIPFGKPADNLHERQRFACTLCGECDIGCNFGSKNTTDFTYLSSVKDKADIRDRHEVRRIAPRAEGGFTVGYVVHRPEREGRTTATSDLPVCEVTCRILVLGAGTLGTTYLLLTNRSALPGLSARLGTRFSGNGDLLGYIRSEQRLLAPSTGPVNTSTTFTPDTVDGGEGRGFYLQEGGLPGLTAWVVETAYLGRLRQAARFVLALARGRLAGGVNSRIGARLAALIGDGRRSANVLPMLGMGRDIPDGTMSLNEGWLAIDWSTATSQQFFDRLEGTIRRVATALDSRYQRNVSTSLGRVITVHPLGGAPMGRDIREGVVDGFGEVFEYPGLFVVDGAAMPGPVGPNPALTIAAFAERASVRMIDRLRNGPRD